MFATSFSLCGINPNCLALVWRCHLHANKILINLHTHTDAITDFHRWSVANGAKVMPTIFFVGLYYVAIVAVGVCVTFNCSLKITHTPTKQRATIKFVCLLQIFHLQTSYCLHTFGPWLVSFKPSLRVCVWHKFLVRCQESVKLNCICVLGSFFLSKF